MNRWVVAGLVTLAAICPSETTLASGSSWSGNGPFGGFVTTIAAAPTNPLVVFAGTSAGVYKSVDGAHSWIGPDAGLPLARVSALAVDPSNAGIVFAAVGDLYRSTDGGATWITVYTRGLDGEPTAVTVDFRDGNRVYAGTGDGYFLRSVDGGESWTTRYTGTPYVNAITVSPTSGSILLCGGGVYRSDDDGNSWAVLTDRYDSYSMTVLPTTPETILLGDAGGSGIQKSTDGGKTWRISSNGLPFKPIGFCASCTLPVTALGVDPDSSHLFAGLYGGGVFTSSDGGDNWTPWPSGVPPDAGVLSFAFSQQFTLVGTADAGVYTIRGRIASPSNEGMKASNVYGIAVTPSSVVFAASGGGISRSSDRGRSWTTATSPGPGTVIPGIWADPSDDGLLFAASEYGGLLRSEDDGLSWTLVVEDGQFFQVPCVAFDPNKPNRIFAGTAPLPLSHEPLKILESDDYGATWVIVVASSSTGSVLWLGFDPLENSTVFARAEWGLLRSTDSGKTWASLDYTSWDVACWAPQAVVLNPWGEHAIYTAVVGGRVICRSADSGLTFQPILYDTNHRQLTSLLADPLRPGTFYAASTYVPGSGVENAVLVSLDHGGTWSEIRSGFPGTEVLSMALDASSSTLFAGTAGTGAISMTLSAGHEKVTLAPNLPPPVKRRAPQN